MRHIADRKETGTTVMLDDTYFSNCTFTNCKLLYSGSDLQWENTFFVGCDLILIGNAQRSANLMENFGWKRPQGGQQAPTPPKTTIQ